MKKVQVEGITGAVAIGGGIIAFIVSGNLTSAILGAAGAGFVTMILVIIYNAVAR